MRGAYTPVAVDLLVKAILESPERMALRKDGIHVADGNLLLPEEEEHLTAALLANYAKPVKKEDPRAGKGGDSSSMPGAMPGFGSAPVKKKSPTAAPLKSEEEGAAAAASALDGMPSKAELDALGKPPAAAPSAATAVDPVAAEAPAAEDAAPAAAAPAAPAATVAPEGKGGKRVTVDEGANGAPKAVARSASGKGVAKSKPKAEGKGDEEARQQMAEGGDEGQPKGRQSYGQQATKKAKKEKKKEEVQVEVNPFAGSPLMIAMSPLIARKGASLDSVVIEENSRVGQGSLVRVAQTEELKDSSKMKPQVEHRMLIALDGDLEALGWVRRRGAHSTPSAQMLESRAPARHVPRCPPPPLHAAPTPPRPVCARAVQVTGISKDETENLKPAARGFPLMKVSRNLAAKESQENDAKKVEDIPKDTMVRVMEEIVSSDGKEMALVARDAPVCKNIGWVVIFKEGMEFRTLLPAPVLKISFDLKVHTAMALSQALKYKGESTAAPRKKRNEGDLPFQGAGKRPTTKPEDGPGASRHKLVEGDASLVMVFNCHNAAFEVTNWTGHESFEKLPGEHSCANVAPDLQLDPGGHELQSAWL